MFPSDFINVQGLQKNYIHIKLKMSAHHHPTPTRFESWKTRAMTRHWNYQIKKKRQYRARYRNSVRWEKNKNIQQQQQQPQQSKCSAPCEWKCLHGKIEKETKKNENKFRTPTSIHTYTAQTHIFLNNSNTESLCVLSPSPFLFPLSLSQVALSVLFFVHSHLSIFCFMFQHI